MAYLPRAPSLAAAAVAPAPPPAPIPRMPAAAPLQRDSAPMSNPTAASSKLWLWTVMASSAVAVLAALAGVAAPMVIVREAARLCNVQALWLTSLAYDCCSGTESACSAAVRSYSCNTCVWRNGWPRYIDGSITQRYDIAAVSFHGIPTAVLAAVFLAVVLPEVPCCQSLRSNGWQGRRWTGLFFASLLAGALLSFFTYALRRDVDADPDRYWPGVSSGTRGITTPGIALFAVAVAAAFSTSTLIVIWSVATGTFHFGERLHGGEPYRRVRQAIRQQKQQQLLAADESSALIAMT